MEEHRKGGAPLKRKLTPTGMRPGKVMIDFPPIRAYVVGGATGHGALAVKTLCDAGCRVAFCDVDAKEGTATAQRCGAQFHPIGMMDSEEIAASIEKVRQSWGEIGLLVDCHGQDSIAGISACADRTIRIVDAEEEGAMVAYDTNVIAIPPSGIDDRALSAMILLLASPAAKGIKGQIFRL